ncbi:HAMP domain-containing sensor histidine kinase [Brevibacillus ginsengisoli]|uniref:HAMP domain-containing sensor histidine kinase n=1 Tax=Brevibacillus ginsengisoli TaxID=363854 RepID=UPI003CEDA865
MRLRIHLKNWPLSRQIVILFMILTITLGAGVGILYPFAIKQYLVQNTFSLLEEEFDALSSHISFNEKNELLPVPASAPFFLQLLLQNYTYSFNVLVFDTNGGLLGHRSDQPITEAQTTYLYNRAATAKSNELQHGTLNQPDESYLFVSKRMNFHGFPYYLVLFSKEQELNQINTILQKQFFLVFTILLLVSWILAVWFSSYLSKPLRKLEDICQKIANRQFDIPLSLDRQDEIGQLARSFDSMKNQLKDYDESQRHFVQNISHELKTPIMAIQGYTQGLLEGVFKGVQAEKGLQIIMEESRRLEDVVEQLLYLTKIESVEEMLEITPLQLSEMFFYLQQRLHVLNPQIHWEIAIPSVVKVEGDGEQLSTAFVNILENQLRYAKSLLKVEAESLQDDVQIVISNDGPPIDEALLPNLFQRFRKGKSGKHGLGLAIARAVIEAHHGTIQASNTELGVSFTILLPKTQLKRSQ